MPENPFKKHSLLDRIPSLSNDPTHPTQIALRTYALALSLSLGPALIPLVTGILTSKRPFKTNLATFKRILGTELGYDGFAFAVTTSVGGGAAIRRIWRLLEEADSHSTRLIAKVPKPLQDGLASLRGFLPSFVLSQEQRTFISNILASSIGILLLQRGRQRALRCQHASGSLPNQPVVSSTLDLTLLLLVRAVDSIVQAFIVHTSRFRLHSNASTESRSHGVEVEPQLICEKLEKEQLRREDNIRVRLTSQVDAIVFWACSARIMWCFFYEPRRLPRSYVKWISALANVDERLIQALRLIREKKWSYTSGSVAHADLLGRYAQELGYPSPWGHPSKLPARGGSFANEYWKKIGMNSRPGVGGIPCEIVHGRVGESLGLSGNCHANSGLRALKAFAEAIAIYLPAHFIPIILTRPQTLLRPHRVMETLVGAFRSATFLTSFITLYWYTVCFCRSFCLAKLLPFISHQFWDGPYGAVMAGSLACGASIWVENGRRRGEMALYVLPRALRTCLPSAWTHSGSKLARVSERIAFIFSITTLLTVATHRPHSLRGLSRWTLAFVMNGPNAGFWKRKRKDPSVPPTPSIPPTPRAQNMILDHAPIYTLNA